MNGLLEAWRSLPGRLRLRVAAVLGLLLVGAVAAGGLGARRWTPRVVERTEWKERVVTRDVVHTVTVEKPVIKWRTRTVEVTKYDTQGNVTEKREERVDAGSKREGSETRTDVVADSQRDSAGHSERSVGSQPQWAVDVLGGASRAGWNVGAHVSHTFIGPLWLGAWVTVPIYDPTYTAAGVSLGLRF